MHDCPTCRVPLHGHEEVCPACGTRQFVRHKFAAFSKLPQTPGVNWTPFILAFVAIAIMITCFAQNTWLGQLLKRGPAQERQADKMTFLDARRLIETNITEGLRKVNAKGRFVWSKADGSTADQTIDQPLTLKIETRLHDPRQRKEIIDPVKDYMAKANMPQLIMTDSKSNATWTYTVQMPQSGGGQTESDQMPDLQSNPKQEQ